MKHLRGSLADLRQFFERAIGVRDIAEPLVSFDAEMPGSAVAAFMMKRGFDVVGVRDSGVVSGFVTLEDLRDNTAFANAMHQFSDGDVLSESAPLLAALQRLRDRAAVFVNVLGQVGGIVTPGDLQKTPVRMWLFGVLSLIEMQLLRIIRETWPNDGWKRHLSRSRVAAAAVLHDERRRRNIETDLLDCLQWSDKAAIVLKEKTLREATGYASRKRGEKLLLRLQDLRNDLAHSNEIFRGGRREASDLAVEAERLLEALERFSVSSGVIST